MMTMKTNCAVIFDCDGVLVDSEALGLQDSVDYLKSYGFSWEASDLVRIFTGYRDDVFRAKLNAAYIDIHGNEPDEGLFEGLINCRRRRKDELQIVKGADKAISYVSQQGFSIAVASSSRQYYLDSKLQRTKLWNLLAPHIYSAEGLKNGKPAPDIFLYAADKISVAPKSCIILEDSTQGVKAGLAANMTVWGFTGGAHCFAGHGARLRAAGAELILPDFDSFCLAIEEQVQKTDNKH